MNDIQQRLQRPLADPRVRLPALPYDLEHSGQPDPNDLGQRRPPRLLRAQVRRGVAACPRRPSARGSPCRAPRGLVDLFPRGGRLQLKDGGLNPSIGPIVCETRHARYNNCLKLKLPFGKFENCSLTSHPPSSSILLLTDNSFIALSRSYARWTIGPKFVSLSLLVLEACGADRSKHRAGGRG